MAVSSIGGKRVRRTSEEARRQILDAAESRLSRLGPEGIRLQDIGRDVGLSHSAILHHFESREGLVRALTERATEQLRLDLLVALDTQAGTVPEPVVVMEKVFEVLAERGYARLAAWLTLAQGEETQGVSPDMINDIIAVIHHIRARRHADEGIEAPGEDDTANIVFLVAMVAFGEGIMGQALRRGPHLPNTPDDRAKFRQWFGALVHQHMADYHRKALEKKAEAGIPEPM